MSDNALRLCRSALFLPASNERAIEKARTLASDMVILDCEDAVKSEKKNLAREQAVAAFEAGFGKRLTAFRINIAGSPWYELDLAAAAQCRADFIVVPKAEVPAHVEQVARAAGKPVLAMIETPRAVAGASEIAKAAAGLIAGTNDLASALGVGSVSGRLGLTTSLQMIVLAARVAEVAVFDGVYNQFQDEAGFTEQCREGRAYGFDGKTLIHPAQIDIANRIFSPTPQEVEDARRLIAAAKGGAERFDDRMIEEMHVMDAEAILAKARC